MQKISVDNRFKKFHSRFVERFNSPKASQGRSVLRLDFYFSDVDFLLNLDDERNMKKIEQNLTNQNQFDE